MMEALIFNLIKLSNSLVDLCFLITLSSDNTDAVGIADLLAVSVMSSLERGAVPTECFGDSTGFCQGLHLLVG